ncbi:GspH/FimT family pseudopilin [Undibacterium sp. WLX3042]|uniref:GspH/FimT family pseudopilin n=1 Tax=Undibacterium sp. WLX3042 TaxID=3412686 RepID=UPI003C2C776E
MKKIFKSVIGGSGFSLVELMVTVAIAAILMAIAAPSFKIFIDNQKLLTTATEFYSAVNMTRSEAIKRGAQVTLAANDGASWTSGWTVFVDTNGNARPDTGETTIFTHDATTKNMEVTGQFTDSASPYVSFTGNGRSRTNTSSQQPQAGTVSFKLGTAIRRVKVNFLGRARICNPDTDLKTCADNATGN